MSLSPIGSGTVPALALVAKAGQAPDPQALKAQANAQADLLQAVRGTELPIRMAMERLAEDRGVDLYL
ncbi:MAG TPA: hypothetical protein VNV66_22415 [Pilimelia sp.]|nr:hypothetical protein [Pilimelia sp.]